MEKRKQKKPKHKVIKKIVAVCCVAVLLVSALVIPCSASSAYGDVRNANATNHINSFPITSLTFTKYSGIVEGYDTYPYSLMTFNTNDGQRNNNSSPDFNFVTYYGDGAQIPFTDGESDIITRQYVRYDMKTNRRYEAGLGHNVVTQYTFYFDKQTTEGEDTYYDLHFNHEYKIKSNCVPLYVSGDEDYSHLSHYLFFSRDYLYSGEDIGARCQVDYERSYVNIKYQIYQPTEEDYSGITESTEVKFDVIQDVNVRKPLNKGTIRYRIFEDVDTDLIDTSKPFFASNVEITMYLDTDVNPSDLPQYRFSIGCPISYEGTLENFDEYVFNIPRVIENVKIEDFSLVKWAVTQINSIMAIDLVLGVALGDILWFIIGIGVMFFLLKVFFGG